MILSDQVKTSKVGALQTYDISLYIKSCCQRDLQNKDVSKCCQRKCSRTHDYTRCTPALHTDHSEIFSSSLASVITSTGNFQDDIFTIEHYKLCCISALHTDQVGSSLSFDLTHHIMWRSSTPDQQAFLFCIKISCSFIPQIATVVPQGLSNPHGSPGTRWWQYSFWELKLWDILCYVD